MATKSHPPDPGPLVPTSGKPFLKCPVIACSSGPDANIYVGRLAAPDGRQRAYWGCVKHVGIIMDGCLSAIRLEPHE